MPRKSRAQLEAEARMPNLLGNRPHLVSVTPLELPAPPDHLSPQMKRWWTEVMEGYALESHHLRQLECACDAFDRMTAARELLLKEGLTVRTAHGSKAHPAAAIERDSRAAFMVALRELDLDCPQAPEFPYHRPPPIKSNRRR